MKFKHLLLAALLISALQSCVVMSPKKHKALLAERDSLANRTTALEEQVSQLIADTARIRQELATLKGNYKGLNDKYNALDKNYNASSSKVSQLSTDLQKREARLKEVEEILRKRDEATNALKDKLQKALLGFQQSGLTVDIRNGKVYVSLTDKLLFPSGSIVIDEKGKQALKQLAAVLNKEADINIAVEGHTDNKKIKNLGQIKDNWDLSVLRATSVTRYLTENENIDPKRLTATGKGEFQPIDTGNSPEALSKNRRIEIVLSPKLDELYNLISK
ncbi:MULTISPECIES: OmpA family protein [unclassified Mucilaginibacter]|uniref:OmpA/MotB family protein n=1 Tax=unclassified Mucilaginibacter TaxID=2617802 RepID=UPI00138DC0F1|nr:MULTISPECIES: OmpA family protein [unclassified Mucilaginibacter]MBB5396326.1 chemotaxis protein MotB [Mucilaginibacter sp. AK015]QHS54517.1 OmpA family protein [Mucilaginibacter sp. 14171R-50]